MILTLIEGQETVLYILSMKVACVDTINRVITEITTQKRLQIGWTNPSEECLIECLNLTRILRKIKLRKVHIIQQLLS